MQTVLIWGVGVLAAASGAVALWNFGNQARAAAAPPVACTLEVEQCPDGTYVGRVGASCAFAECPSTSNVLASGETAKLQIGQSATVGGLTVLPYKILEDSRCPPDTTCKLVGTVRLEAQIIQTTGSGDAQLILGQQFNTETSSIVLTGVEPGPQKEKIPEDQYLFSIQITQH